MSKKKILILGGKPIGSIDMINYAKAKGLYVIVCDYLPIETSPAKQIADEAWDYSTADVDIIVERAKKENVDAVFTGVHEFNINKCREICEKLNIPFYASKEEMSVSSNKRIYKDIFKKFDIPVIPEYKITDINSIPDNIEYPILIKPTDGSGAYGLQICNSKEEVQSKFEQALKYSDKKELLAEKYIKDKEEITTVYIIKDSVPYLAAVSDRVVKYFDNAVIPLPIQYIWNSKHLGLYEKTIDEKMKKSIKHMGLRNGMLFIQSIVKDNVIMPYDIGFRLSGTQEHVIFESVCGYNPLKLAVDYSLTGEYGNENLTKLINPHFNQAASQITFLTKPATIGCFEGLEEVSEMQGVIRCIKNKLEGETIPESALGTLNQVALRIFVKAKDQEALSKLVCTIRQKIKILSNENKEIGI